MEIFLKANESHKKTERGGETMEKETQEIPSAANKLYGEQAKLLWWEAFIWAWRTEPINMVESNRDTANGTKETEINKNDTVECE